MDLGFNPKLPKTFVFTQVRIIILLSYLLIFSLKINNYMGVLRENVQVIR